MSYNLATIQGGAEVMFELVTLLGREDFARAWLQYCRIGGAPADVLKRDQKTGADPRAPRPPPLTGTGTAGAGPVFLARIPTVHPHRARREALSDCRPRACFCILRECIARLPVPR